VTQKRRAASGCREQSQYALFWSFLHKGAVIPNDTGMTSP
jgi:hypothetical protein